MSNELPGTFKVVTLWLLVGAAVFLGFQWYEREQRKTEFRAEGDVIEIRRGNDGHYHWPGTINGLAVDFLVDTGATGTAIPSALARELRLESEGKARASTAGGAVVGEIARADVVLQGGVRVDRLRVVALPGLSGNPLLGMDVLGRLQWQQQAGVLRIDLRSASGSNR
ncbi:MAG TPA: retropepsin-like aspartic protease [Caldimonas sp.]|jgi:aspartyl protease family protein|nr:retropepsin-like aspartic protease [Caldimonas sp.]HEX2539642.1 retropepsin-like aspartic protease [Caldimonas sp.]